MSQYKPYPEYKDSGIEFFGEIPVHWNLSPFKWHIVRNDGGVWGEDADGIDDTVVLRSTEQTVDGEWTINDPAMRKLTKKEKEFSLLKAGDILITKSSGSVNHIGKASLVTEKIESIGACYSNFMQRIRVSTNINPKLAWYLLNCQVVKQQFNFLSNTSTGLSNLNASTIGTVIIPIPSTSEQALIVGYLNSKTASIDSLIEKQAALITLLREKRQAIITEAVTKGLDPNVPMKDSGVEWLGDVPEHWIVSKIKKEYTIKSGIDKKFEKGIYPLFGANGLIGFSNTFSISSPTVVIGRVGSAGEINYVNKCCGVSDNALIIKNVKNDTPRYDFYLFQSIDIKSLISKNAQPLITATDIMEKFYACPFESTERNDISIYLDEKISMIDILIEKINSMINLLREKRQSIISEAVTGKIDLR